MYPASPERAYGGRPDRRPATRRIAARRPMWRDCPAGQSPPRPPRTSRPRSEEPMNRRTVASLCLFVSLALHLASYFLRPAGSEGSAAAQLATAAAHPAATAAAALVETAGWVLLLPALMALWGEVRGRGAVLVGLGAWGAVLGVLGFTAGGVLNVITVDLARSPRGIAAFTAIQHDGVVFGVFVLAIMLGP